jgi:hypothetical protein
MLVGGCLIFYVIPSFHAQSYRFGSLPPSMSESLTPDVLLPALLYKEGREGWRKGGYAPILGVAE